MVGWVILVRGGLGGGRVLLISVSGSLDGKFGCIQDIRHRGGCDPFYVENWRCLFDDELPCAFCFCQCHYGLLVQI